MPAAATNPAIVSRTAEISAKMNVSPAKAAVDDVITVVFHEYLDLLISSSVTLDGESILLSWLVWGGKIYSEIEMKKAEPNEELGISTLGFVFAHVAHLRRFVHLKT